MASATPSHPSDLRIVLLGKNRAEISSVGNLILGREAFKEKSRESEVQNGRVEDRNISVIGTPGFFNPQLTDEDLQNEMMKSLSLSHPGPHVFLLIVRPDTFTEDDVRKIVQKLEKNFGLQVLKFTLVLFIRDHISNKEWMALILSKKCQDLISHFKGRYHVKNNDSDTTEITTLVEKLDDVVRQNDDQHYSNESYVMFSKVRKQEQREKVQVPKTNKEFGATSKLETRLLGRGVAQNLGPCAKATCGARPHYMSDIGIGAAGKNATRNNILRNNLFKEEMSFGFSHHTKEHHTYEMYQEPSRKYAEEQEKERDKLRRTEKQRSREEKLRIREEELKKREEELKKREEELRKKEETENLKKIYTEMRMNEFVRSMSMRRKGDILKAFTAARAAAEKQTQDTPQIKTKTQNN